MTSASTASQFDLSPLTWVKSEIDLALDRAAQALKKFGANPQDATEIKFCRTHLHQVRGALAIVGLDGVTSFVDALEHLLADIEEGRQAGDGVRIQLLGRAVDAISQYLDGLVAGQPDQPLRLFAVYSELALARGLPAPAGSELFFPDLSRRPDLRPMAALAPGVGASKLRAARARFQKGLLAWLKAPDQPNGAQELQLSAVEISGSDEAPALRAFWWAVSGLFAAVAERKLADTAQIKHLLARIDQQIRRQMEGGRAVPERLMRDVLYGVATCRSERAVVKEIRRTYGLDDLLPAATVAGGTTEVQLEPIARRLREIATGAEEAWSKFCGGTPQALAPFREASATLHQGSDRLGHTDFRRLTQALTATAAWLAEQPSRHTETLAIEMATAILVIGNALDNFSHLGADFVHQVDVMVARLHACIAGTPLPADAELPALDEMSRRAQERLLIAQVVREIQSNLGQVEQALDTFFRDTAQRDALASLSGPLHQIEGALTILGHDAAVRALRTSGESIGRFAAADYVPSGGDFETVANQLSALGFFVESLQGSGGGDYEEFLRRLEAGPAARQAVAEERFSATEVAPQGLPEPAMPATPGVPEPTVQPAEPEDFATTVVLPSALPEFEDFTSTVVLAPTPKEKPVPAMAEPAAGPLAEPLLIMPAEPPAPVAPATVAPVAPAEVQASAEEIDAELLEIFLEEAGEVLATIAENLEALRNRPTDAEALTTVRRAFHTLKGSSRMVGLKDFGEVAWSIEQVHNQWLRQELKVSAELINLDALAHEVFSAWVSHLASGTGAVPDAVPLVTMAERLRGVETATAAPSPTIPAEPLVSVEESAPTIEIELPEALEFAAPEEPVAAPTGITLPTEAVLSPALELVTYPASVPEAVIPVPMPASSDIEAIEISSEALSVADEVVEELVSVDQQATVSELPSPAEQEFSAPEEPALSEAGIEIPVEASIPPALELVAEPAFVLETVPSAPVPSESAAIEISSETLPVADEGGAEPLSAGQATTISELPSVLQLDASIEVVDLPLEAFDEVVEPVAEEPLAEVTIEAAELPAEPETAAVDSAILQPPVQQTITVSPALYEIFLEEAHVHLATLQRCFGELEIDPAAPTAIEMVRAAHTLGSIAGTVGFATVKRLGHALEDALLRRTNTRHPDSLEALESLRLTIAELEQMVAALAANEPPSDSTGLVDTLAGLYPLAVTAPAELAPEAGLLAPAVTPVDGGLPEDRLDHDLLPIFLEEAKDLVAGVAERFDRWRDNPADADSMHALGRLLHTLKGSARMAGAMQVGARVHELESRIEHVLKVGDADASAVVDLQSDFDDIAQRIAELHIVPVAPALPDIAPTSSLDSATTGEVIDVTAFMAPATVPLPAEAETAAPEIVPEDRLDEQLLPIFLEEATELTQAVYEHLDTLHANPADAEAAHGLARALHTIKGSARMAGAMSLGFLTHTLETRIEEASRAGQPDRALIDEVRSTFDTLAAVIEGLQRGEVSAPIAAIASPESTEPAPEASVVTDAAELPAAKPTEATVLAPPEPAIVAKAKEDTAPKPMLRVRADLFDHLANDAGELSIARARIEGEMRNLKQSLLDLTENVIRLRRQLREIEIQAETQMQSKIALASETTTHFDPLELDRFTRFQELTRMMAESVNDVATVQQNLLKNLDEANAGLLAQSRLNRELQQQLMAVRMVPFASITERLYRIVRQTAKELDKRTDLEIKGSQLELDQNVINKMIGPLEHLLRNAIAHGIESPEVRRAAGKDEMGEIVLSLRQEGNEVVITMSDDGGGLHYDRIRAKAVAHGLLAADETVDERRLAELIFSSGFSTASEVTQVSGRGVGMDVVKTEVASLGGRIDLTSEAGRGSTFRIYLPLTMAVTNAVLVRVAGRTYAIPASMIEQVQEVKEEVLAGIRDAGQVVWQNNAYPFYFLPRLLGDPDSQPEARRLYWLLMLYSGAQRIAIQVDELQRTQEIVVKNIGPQLARVVGIAGATVLGDGRVALILNPVALAARAPLRPSATAVAAVAPTVAAPVATLPTVFVVDDSLTVRKITGRLLAREGYQVVTAKDGVDALEQLVELTPDVIISDIEMPRMDGFELARRIRGDERLKGIPIIMITSRTAEKHRAHAIELGVNDYLGKPYQEEELLARIATYIAQQRTRH